MSPLNDITIGFHEGPFAVFEKFPQANVITNSSTLRNTAFTLLPLSYSHLISAEEPDNYSGTHITLKLKTRTGIYTPGTTDRQDSEAEIKLFI